MFRTFASTVVSVTFGGAAFGQPEVMAWGNLTGLRVDGHLLELIKAPGATFANKGLATKLALGDNSDASSIDFIQPALHDPEAAKYVGAVDFHSWHGCTDEILAQWRDAARELNDVPLVVVEGSTDAAAWRNPQVFNE